MERLTNRREFLTKGAAAAGLLTLGGTLLPQESQAAPVQKYMASARDFGAKGDGKTDDTAALQKAFKDASIGTAIFLPKGEYVVSGPIDLKTNQALIGEPLSTKLLVKHYDAPAIRVPCAAKVSDLMIVYPENTELVNPKECVETISLVGNGAGFIENITFYGAFVGVGTPIKGANCGQSVIRNLNGFVHDTMVRIDGSLDIIRIENVHCFAACQPNDDGKSYYRNHRKCLHIKSSDGTLISKTFMIFGDIFLLKEGGEHGGGLSTYLSECWLEGAKSYGVQLNDATRMSMVGMEMTCAYAKAVVEINNGGYIRMNSCYFRDSLNSVGVRVNEGSGLMMSQCEFAGTPGFTAVELNSSAQSIITNNYMHHCEVGITGKGADNYIITGNQLGANTPLALPEAKNTIVKDNL